MLKKIAAAILSLAVIAVLFVLFFPRGADEAPPVPDTSEGFTVGVGKITGSFSPFFAEENGDR